MEHNPVIVLFLALAIIIMAARGAGALARRLNQPRVLGELIVGVILGPTLIDLFHASAFGIEQAHMEETVIELAELGVLFLMFKVGLEVHLAELLKVGRVATIAGIIGAVLPVMVTVPLLLAFEYDWRPALFAGVTFAATSVSISAQVLLELNVLNTKEGNGLLATALIDDVVAILLVSLTIAVTGPDANVDPSGLVLIVVRMAAFIVVASLLAWYVLPYLAEVIYRHPEDSEAYGIPAYALMMALFFAWAAEYFGGVATITGGFIAGVGLSRSSPIIKNQIEVAVNNLSYSFLLPIFFVSVGLQTDLSGFPMSAVPLAALMLIFAILSKVVGCGLGAYAGGFNRLESLRLGTCMISRGEVGLIIAALGISSGVFDPGDALFASLFMVILLTTVITPPFVRRVFEMQSEEAEAHVEAHSSHYTTN